MAMPTTAKMTDWCLGSTLKVGEVDEDPVLEPSAAAVCRAGRSGATDKCPEQDVQVHDRRAHHLPANGLSGIQQANDAKPATEAASGPASSASRATARARAAIPSARVASGSPMQAEPTGARAKAQH